MKRFSLFLSGILLFFYSCSGSQTPPGHTSIDFLLPENSQALIRLPEYKQTVNHMMNALAYFFGTEGMHEVRDKFFANLRQTLSIDVLSDTALEDAGFDTASPILLSVHGEALYASVPLLDAERFKQYFSRRAPAFELLTIPAEPAENDAAIHIALSEGTFLSVIVSANRAYFFYGFTSINYDSTASAPEKWKESSTVEVLLDRSIARGLALPFTFSRQIGGSIRILENRYLLQFSAASISLPLFTEISTFIPELDFPADTVFAWMPPGRGTLPVFGGNDILFVEAGFNPERIWSESLRPAILAEARRHLGRSTGQFGGIVSDFLSGDGKPLEERILDGLNLEDNIIQKLTGRTGFIFHKVGDISLSRYRYSIRYLTDTLEGVLALECRSSSDPQAIIDFVIEQIQTLGISLTAHEHDGTTVYSPPKGMLPAANIFFAPAGRYILFSNNRETLAAFAASPLRSNPANWLDASILQTIDNRSRRITASFSVPALYANISKALDSQTRANLRPLEQQILRLQRINIVLSSAAQGHQLDIEFRLPENIPSHDVFSDTISETDWVLLILGSFFASLILIAVLRKLYKKIRYRP